MEVIIIGAGCTGLILAHGLQKNGIAVQVYEQEESSTFRPREWSMGMHWSLPLLQSLLPAALFAELRTAQNDPHDPGRADGEDEFRIYDGLSGGVLKAIPLPRTVRVSRRKMRALLCRGLEPVVRYGKTLASIEYPQSGQGGSGGGVVAHFADGSSASGSLLVGADGPRSTVRTLLLGAADAAASPLQLCNSQMAVRYGDAAKARHVRSAHPVFFSAVHPEMLFFQTIADVPSPDRPEDWSFLIFVGWQGEQDHALTDEQRLKLVKDRAATMAEPMKSALEWIPEGTPVHYDSYNYWVTKPWHGHAGAVTLAGDAAHPMPPHRGQGLNHAIADCAAIVAACTAIASGTQTQTDALAAYDAEVVKRGSQEVTEAVQNAGFLTNYEMVNKSMSMQKGLARST